MSHRISGYYIALDNSLNICQHTPILFGTQPFIAQHRVFPADFALNNLLLDSYQIDNTRQEAFNLPILPDGCINIFFLFEQQKQHAFILGPTTFSRKIFISPKASLFAMRLQPGCSDWLGITPATDLGWEIFPLHLYLKNTDQLLMSLKHAESFHERILFAVHSFNSNKAAVYRRIPLLAHCIHTINKEHGNLKINNLAKQLGCCTRYLDMIFRRHVGLSTKNYCDISRMQHALQNILERPELQLCEIALDCGFFDQAHMNRNFKKFTGTTASSFRKPYNIAEGKLGCTVLNLTDMEA